MSIKLTSDVGTAKELFLDSLQDKGFEVQKVGGFTEAIRQEPSGYIIITITTEGEIVIFSKRPGKTSRERQVPRWITLYAPKTQMGYTIALLLTKREMKSVCSS